MYKNIFTQIDNNEIDLIIEEITTRYEKKIEEINPSDMLLDSIDYITIKYWRINPFNINSYIPLPFKSKYCVNIKNEDNQCFKWLILAKLFPTNRDPNRVLKYKSYENYLDFGSGEEKIEFPVQTNSIQKFEKLNNLRINVYQLVDVKTKKNYTSSYKR